MVIPPPLPCDDPDCTFETEADIPTHELRQRRLESHIALAHRQQTQRAKPSQIPRPELGEDASEQEWSHFKVKWERYKRSSLLGLDKNTVIDHLLACCPTTLEDAVWKQMGKNPDTEEELLEMMKKLGVRKRNILLNKVAFLDMRQEQGQPVKLFVAKLRGQAAVCDFTLPTGVTDYSEQMILHQLVRGFSDPMIQEHVLAHAATNEGSNMKLAETINMIEAKECGKLDTESLQKSSVNKMTEYRKQSKNDLKCDYCDQKGHGRKPSMTYRKKNCPAFDHKCETCGLKGHFKSVCRKNPKALKLRISKRIAARTLRKTIHVIEGTIHAAGQFCSFTAVTKGDEGDVKAK